MELKKLNGIFFYVLYENVQQNPILLLYVYFVIIMWVCLIGLSHEMHILKAIIFLIVKV